MKKNIIKIYSGFLTALAFIGIPLIAHADVPSPWPTEPISVWLQLLWFFLGLTLVYIINGIILLVSFLIMKKHQLAKSWRFLLYIFIVTIGGAFIDLIYVAGPLISILIYPKSLDYTIIILLICICLTSLALFFYNYWLAKKFFNLAKKESIIIGLVMGIITNPAWVLLTPYLISGIFYL